MFDAIFSSAELVIIGFDDVGAMFPGEAKESFEGIRLNPIVRLDDADVVAGRAL